MRGGLEMRGADDFLILSSSSFSSTGNNRLIHLSEKNKKNEFPPHQLLKAHVTQSLLLIRWLHHHELWWSFEKSWQILSPDDQEVDSENDEHGKGK